MGRPDRVRSPSRDHRAAGLGRFVDALPVDALHRCLCREAALGLRHSRSVAHDDPEAAARGSIPPRFAHTLAVAVAPGGDLAVVLLGTNEPPDLYPYQVICKRSRDGWEEGASANGPGWTSVSGGAVGIETYWGEAPEGASEVVVPHHGERHRVPVTNRYYLFVAWNELPNVRDDDEQANPDPSG